MRFSFIVPVYNTKMSYLESCVHSLVTQTVRDFGILLIDDGSNNGAEEYCDIIKQNYDEAIKVFHKNNGGVSTARNEGIRQANGDYLIFVDPDDWVENNICEKIGLILEKYDFDILTYFYFIEFKNKSVYEYSSKDGNIRLILNEERIELIRNLIDTNRKMEYKYFHSSIFGAVWGKCFKKSFLIENNIWFKDELIKAQDTIFNLEAFYAASLVTEYKAPLYHYRMVKTSITHFYNKNIINIQLLFLNAVKEFINTHELDASFQEAFMHRCILSYFNVLDLDIFNEANKDNLKKKKEEWLEFVNVGYLNNLSTACINRYSWRTKFLLKITEMKFFTILSILYEIRKICQKKSDYDDFFE